MAAGRCGEASCDDCNIFGEFELNELEERVEVFWEQVVGSLEVRAQVGTLAKLVLQEVFPLQWRRPPKLRWLA